MNNKKFNILIIILFVLIASLTIGYSAFNNQLYISDTSVTIGYDIDVRITSVSINSTSGGGISNSETRDVDYILSDLYLPNSNSTVTYTVEVKNFGNVEMGINDISIEGNLNNVLKITPDSGVVGKIISNGETTLGITKTFNITIGYQDGAYNSVTDYNFGNVKINVDFKRVYRVTVTDAADLVFSEDQLIAFEGEDYTLSLNLANYYFKSTMDNQVVENSTYNNGVLTIPNVTGIISIVGFNIQNFDFAIEPGTMTITTDKVSSTNPVSIADFLNMSLSGGNFSDQRIDSMDVVYTFTSSTGASQSVKCVLTVKGTRYEQQITFTKANQPKTITASFTGLNIGLYDEFTITTENVSIGNGKINIHGETINLHYS